MNLREALQRHLNESKQVVQTRGYKWLTGIYLILLLAGSFHVFELDYWQMRRVRKHIENISLQWDAFKRAHPGFGQVELFPRYDEAYGVSLAAKGSVHWSMDLKPLVEFMRSSQLPFSIDISQLTTDLPHPATKKMTALTPDGRRIEVDVDVKSDTAKSRSEPAGSANGSQPIRLETNSSTSAAGSHR